MRYLGKIRKFANGGSIQEKKKTHKNTPTPSNVGLTALSTGLAGLSLLDPKAAVAYGAFTAGDALYRNFHPMKRTEAQRENFRKQNEAYQANKNYYDKLYNSLKGRMEKDPNYNPLFENSSGLRAEHVRTFQQYPYDENQIKYDKYGNVYKYNENINDYVLVKNRIQNPKMQKKLTNYEVLR